MSLAIVLLGGAIGFSVSMIMLIFIDTTVLGALALLSGISVVSTLAVAGLVARNCPMRPPLGETSLDRHVLPSATPAE